MTQNGSGHHFQIGSDLQRDGMYLEMLDASEVCVAEVFYSDVTGKMIVTLEQPGVSIEAVEELLSKAKVRLTPLQKPDQTMSVENPAVRNLNLLSLERPALLAIIAAAIGEMTILARGYYDEPNAAKHLCDVNEAIHRLAGHLQALVDLDVKFTTRCSDGVAEQLKLLPASSLNRLYRLVA